MPAKEDMAKLCTGATMPRLGLGTWKSPADKTKVAVKTAIRAGYRLIDCANDYGNEHVIGEALQELFAEGVVKREELFIQVKLWNTNHRPEHVRPDLEETLKDLQVSYVDSYLIHWPHPVPSTGKGVRLRKDGPIPAHHSKNTMFPMADDGLFAADLESHYIETWQTMEQLVDEGLTMSIGLSNFNRTQVQEILQIPNLKHRPAVLQNESHPYLHEKDLRDFCRINGIVFQAHSPLGSNDRPWKTPNSLIWGPPVPNCEVLENPTIKKLGEKHKKTSAQIVLRWHLQMGGSMLAKSVTPSRIEENYNIFDFTLSTEDMKIVDDLNIGWRHLVFLESIMHPDFPFKECIPYGYKLGKPGTEPTFIGSK